MSKSKSPESVKVVVRCRPMNEKERAANFERVVSVDVKLGQVAVRNPRGATAHEHPKVFTFDSVYDWNSKQVIDRSIDRLTVFGNFNNIQPQRTIQATHVDPL